MGQRLLLLVALHPALRVAEKPACSGAWERCRRASYRLPQRWVIIFACYTVLLLLYLFILHELSTAAAAAVATAVSAQDTCFMEA